MLYVLYILYATQSKINDRCVVSYQITNGRNHGIPGKRPKALYYDFWFSAYLVLIPPSARGRVWGLITRGSLVVLTQQSHFHQTSALDNHHVTMTTHVISHDIVTVYVLSLAPGCG